MIKNEYVIYYKQWKDYFDFLEVRIILPEISYNNYGISKSGTGIFYSELYSPKRKSFTLNLSNEFIYDRGSEGNVSLSLRIFGVGLSIERVLSY